MTIVPKVLYPKDDYRIVVRQVLRVGDDLHSQFKAQAMLYGRVAHFSAQAKRHVRELKSEIDVLAAKLRKIITRRSGRRLTKDEMSAALTRKKSYRLKQKQLNDAVYHEDIISGLLRALEHKKDCLTQLGAASRHEMPDELRMLERELKKRRR